MFISARSIIYTFFLILAGQLCFGQSGDTLPLLFCVDRQDGTGYPTLRWVDPPVKACGSAGSVIVRAVVANSQDFSNIDTFRLPLGLNEYVFEQRFASAFQLTFLYPTCSGGDAVVYSNILDPARLTSPVLRSITVDDPDLVVQWDAFLDGIPGIRYRITVVESLGQPETILVDGMNTTSYRIPGGAENPERVYFLYAIDSCGIISREIPFSFIFLTSENDNFCQGAIDLSWSESLIPSERPYIVQWRPSGGSWQNIDSTEQTSLGARFPLDTNVFDLRVISISPEGDTSLSNELSFNFPSYDPPSFAIIRNASFNNQNTLEVSYLVDDNGSLSSVSLRENADIFDIPSPYDGNYTVGSPDLTANTIYALDVTDQCDISLFSRDFVSPLLFSEQRINNIRLTTVPFLSDNHDITAYSWYRVDPGDGNRELLGTGSINEWDLAPDEPEGFCYQVDIESVFTDNADVQTSIITQSNINCLLSGFLVFVPNVACLSCTNTANERILPSFSIESAVSNYSFEIYDRGGAQLFSTRVLGEYWGLREDLQDFTGRTYTYVLRYSLDNSPAMRTQTGTFLLLP